MPPVKCVILGNGNVGKSTLIHSYINRHFTPAPGFSCGHYLTKATATDRSRVDLLLCDTLGCKDYERINRLSYPHTEVVLICFSIERPEDLFYVNLRWITEIRNYCPPAVPIVLVGTKVDTRNENKSNPRRGGYVTYEQGLRLAQDLHALDYKECSSLHDIGVSAVFDTAVTCGLYYRSQNRPQTKKRTCSLM